MRKVLFIFGQLKDGDVSWLAKAGRRERVSAGATLISEGVRVDTLYIVLQGELLVSQGADKREVARLGAGEVVGEMSFIDARPPSATVTAATEAVLYAVPKARLEQELSTNTAFAARFYRALAIFLSDRVRRALGGPGGDADELDDNVLDNVDRAGARFDSLSRQLLEG